MAEQEKLAPLRTVDDITIKLSSRAAVRLWEGKKKAQGTYSVLGVPGFCKMLRGIEDAIRKDDPYADYHFHQIELAIAALHVELNQELKAINEIIESSSSSQMTIPELESRNPVVYPVRFASRMGFLFVRQLLLLDQIYLKYAQAHYIALVSTKEKATFGNKIERKMRGLMNLVFRFKNCEVSRDDMAAGNQVAQRAIDKMGEIPKGYLTGEVRSEEAPYLPAKRMAVLNSQKKVNETSVEEEGITQPDQETA